MAVALATLPLYRLAAGDGEGLLTTSAGAGLAGDFAATGAGLAAEGLLAGLAAATGLALEGLAATGLAAGFAETGLAAGLATTFLAAALLSGAFFTGRLLGAVFFTATDFAAGLAAGFLAAGLAGFLAMGLATGFFAAGFLAAGLDTAFFEAAGLAAGLPPARAVFATALPASRPLVADALAGERFTIFALAGALLLAALAAVELRVVFAISLHHLWPWRPGVIAHVSCTGKHTSGILVPLHPTSRTGSVNVLTRLILCLLGFYKRWLSPLLGSRCRFHPSCSDYARIAVTRFGPWRGSLLGLWRLLRCQPLCAGGDDPVPEQFRFPRCRSRKAS